MSSPTAPAGGRRVVRAEQVPPSMSPSDAALPPTAKTQLGETLAPGLFHLLRRVNYPARRIPTFRWVPRASSMCRATTEVPRFLSRDALHANTLTSHKTGDTQIRHLGSCLFRMIGDYFTHGADFSFLLLRTVLPSLIGLRIPGGPGGKEFLPFSLSDTVSGSARGNNPEKRARKTSRKKSNMISESGLQRAAVLLLVRAPLLPLRHHRGNRAPLFGEPVRRTEQRSHRSATHARRRRRRRRVQPTAIRHSGDCGRDGRRREGEKAG